MRNTTIRKIKPEKVAVLHVCSQKEQIAQLINNTNKLSVIITGNGNPEEGYVFKVAEMGREIKDINEKLTGITGIVKELHEESIGKKAVEKKKIITFENGLKVLGVIIACGMLVLGYINLTKQNKTVGDKVDNMGVPVVTNSRGQMLMLPDSAKIKFLFNDSLSYTIKRIEK